MSSDHHAVCTPVLDAHLTTVGICSDMAESAAELRIVIGENNEDLAMTLSLLLGAEPDMRCVATVSSSSAVLAALEAHAPNAFVLDLSLDDGSSLPLITTLRAARAAGCHHRVHRLSE